MSSPGHSHQGKTKCPYANGPRAPRNTPLPEPGHRQIKTRSVAAAATVTVAMPMAVPTAAPAFFGFFVMVAVPMTAAATAFLFRLVVMAVTAATAAAFFNLVPVRLTGKQLGKIADLDHCTVLSGNFNDSHYHFIVPPVKHSLCHFPRRCHSISLSRDSDEMAHSLSCVRFFFGKSLHTFWEAH